MSRYSSDFEGIPGGFSRPTGADPNYRHGYRGNRMGAEPGQAAYGAQRRRDRYDLETWGGFRGIHPGGRHHGFDRGTRSAAGGGGMRDPFRDREFQRGFNANSPAFGPGERGSGQYDSSFDNRGPQPDWLPERRLRRLETDRGVPPAGFGEGWARGPMRGSR
jgi:hypothetical protein